MFSPGYRHSGARKNPGQQTAIIAQQRQQHQPPPPPPPLQESSATSQGSSTAKYENVIRPRALTDDSVKHGSYASSPSRHQECIVHRGSLPPRIAEGPRTLRRREPSDLAKFTSPPIFSGTSESTSPISNSGTSTPRNHGKSGTSRRRRTYDIALSPPSLASPVAVNGSGTTSPPPFLPVHHHHNRQERGFQPQSQQQKKQKQHHRSASSPKHHSRGTQSPVDDSVSCPPTSLISELPPPSDDMLPIVLPPGFCEGPEEYHPMVINPVNFDMNETHGARFFVAKSSSESDVFASIKYCVWSSTDAGNKKIDKAYRDQQCRTSIVSSSVPPVYLVFSVNGSGQFCGVAKVMSRLDVSQRVVAWQDPERWHGFFRVQWIFVKNIPNSYLRHIHVPNCDNMPVTNSRDAQELMEEEGREILSVFYSFRHSSCLLDPLVSPSPSPSLLSPRTSVIQRRTYSQPVAPLRPTLVPATPGDPNGSPLLPAPTSVSTLSMFHASHHGSCNLRPATTFSPPLVSSPSSPAGPAFFRMPSSLSMDFAPFSQPSLPSPLHQKPSYPAPFPPVSSSPVSSSPATGSSSSTPSSTTSSSSSASSSVPGFFMAPPMAPDFSSFSLPSLSSPLHQKPSYPPPFPHQMEPPPLANSPVKPYLPLGNISGTQQTFTH